MTEWPIPPVTPGETWAVRGKGVLPGGLVEDMTLVVQGDKQVHAGPSERAPAIGETFDWDGLILPGLVDIHCHGGGGASFPDATSAEQAMVAIQEHRRHGTTTLVASLVTDSPQVLLERTAMLVDLAVGGELAGIHLEGPFLSAARSGAQSPEQMLAPDPGLVIELAQAARGYLATMTLAPELPMSLSVVEALAEQGAVPSFGHTDATAPQLTAAVVAAAQALAGAHSRRSALPTATHLFNGMRPPHHRDPGPVLACLAAAANQRMVLELIADGVHVHPDTVSLVFDLVGAENIALMTDAMAAAGLRDGEYQLGPQQVVVVDGVARLAGGGSLAGGTAHLIDVVRSAVLHSGIDLAQAVLSASLVPARVLGLENQVGALGAGLKADFVLTNSQLQPQAVYRAGQLVAP
ncbi:MAG: amidohydrolase family protein [Micrococcales bacterium]|nr:amidohydrolase family protein [Micrococcales bacterium]